MRKNLSKLLPFTWVTIVLMLLALPSFAQNVVSGKVTDSKDGTAAASVTVTVKGTKTATQTTTDGTFSISAPDNAILVFSSVSFARQEVAVNFMC